MATHSFATATHAFVMATHLIATATQQKLRMGYALIGVRIHSFIHGHPSLAFSILFRELV
jgi:hypothetical protein